jgi:hypothetical protein
MPSLFNVVNQPSTCFIERHFFAEHGRFKQASPDILAPLGGAQGQNVVLHDRGCCSDIQQI